MRDAQLEDESLQQMSHNPHNWRLVDNVELVCHNDKPEDVASPWKIALPESMVTPTIAFFHQLCNRNHPSHSLLSKTLDMFCHPHLHARVRISFAVIVSLLRAITT